jgi:hypothetical protein
MDKMNATVTAIELREGKVQKRIAKRSSALDGTLACIGKSSSLKIALFYNSLHRRNVKAQLQHYPRKGWSHLVEIAMCWNYSNSLSIFDSKTISNSWSGTKAVNVLSFSLS